MTILQRFGRFVIRLLLVLMSLLVVALVVVPALPVVRARVLNFAQTTAEDAGITLDYGGSGGHLLTGIQLRDVSLAAPGLDASLDDARLAYNLLGLLRRELPISLRISGLTADVDVADVQTFAAQQFQGGGSGSAPPIRPVIQNVQVDDISVRVNDIPFDVPDLALTSLTVTEIDDGLQVATTLATSEGNAQLQADVNLTPLTVNGQIIRADARLARPWFEGINAGTLSGDVTVIEDDIRADVRLDGGEVVLPTGGQTLVLDNIQGPVTFVDDVATTTLTSDVLGGRLELTANADLTAEQWQASAQLATDLAEVGELASLADALSGTLNLQADASGWEQVQANLSLNGSGEAFGEPINTLSGNARFDSDVTDGVGLNASLTAELDGASLRADVTPTVGGLEGLARVMLEDFSAATANNLSGQLEARFRQTDTLTGGLTGNIAGNAIGRQLDLNLEANVLDDVADGFGLRTQLNADTNLGEQLSGDVTLRGAAIAGRLELTSLTAPGLTSPVNATLTTDGTLDNLPFTLQVDSVQVPSVASNFDGQLSGRWQAGAVNDISAQLGPLRLTGQVSLADGGSLEVNLSPTSLAPPLSGQVAMTNGEVNLTHSAAGWQVTTTAQLQTDDISTATVNLSDIQADVRAEVGNDLRVSVVDEHVNARIGGNRVDATLDDYALTLSGTPVVASGEVTTSLGDILTNLQMDLRVESVRDDLTSPGLRASVRGPAEALVVDVSADAGIQAGGVTLARSAALSGTVNAQTQAADLRGFVGGVNVDVSSDVNGQTRNVEASLSSLGETFNINADVVGTQVGRWQTTGTLPLNPLADALSLENLSGQVAGELGYSAGNYEGGLELDLTINDQVVDGSLIGQGDALQVTATSIVADLPVELTGQLTGPVTSAQLNADVTLADFGTVNLAGTPANLQLQGEGILPGVAAAGLDVQPWTLTGSLQDGISATVGDSNVQLSQLNGLAVAANIRQPVRVQNLTVTPEVDVQFNSATATSELTGQILLASPTQTASLPVSGTLDGLQVGGRVPLDLLTDAFGADVPADLSGESLELSLFADVLGTPSYRALALWQDVRLEADGTGGNLSASLQADDLQATFSQTPTGSQLTVNANAANLSEIVPGLPLAAVVDGNLDYDLGSRRWQGELGITTRSPVVADVALRGVGSQLALDLSATQEPVKLDVSGNLLPRLRLAVTADTSDDPLTASPVRFDGTVLGSLASPQLEGLLVTSAVRQTEPVSVDVPPQRIGVEAGLAEAGLYLELSNTSLISTDDNLQLRNGQWSGALNLPFELADATHTLALRAEGELAAPQLTANLSGEVVSGEVAASTEVVHADVQLVADVFELVPDAVSLEPVNLQAEFTPSTGNYTANVTTSGSYLTDAASLPFSTQLNVEGNGTTYELRGDVIAAGEVLPLTLQGEAGNLSGTINLNSLELATFADIVPNLTGLVDGLINIAVQDGDVQLAADVQAVGSAAGQAFDVDVRVGLEDGVDVQGEVAGVQVGLRGPLASAGVFNLALTGEPFDVTAHVDVAEIITIRASGQVLEEALQVQGQLASNLSTGNLNANIGNARLDARLTADALTAGRQLGVQVNVPEGSVIPQDVTANAIINLAEAVLLESLTLTSNALDLQASASGSLTPRLDIQAELLSTQLPEPLNTPITVLATTTDNGTVVEANIAETVIRAALGDGVQVVTAGGLELPQFGVNLENGLTWSAETGFSGQSVVSAELTEDIRARLELTGTETLTITGNVNANDTNVASLNLMASARPWQAGEDSLQGSINLALPVGQLAPVGVVADVSLEGQLTSPQVAGNVQLLDDLGVLAEGDVTASLEGASVNLSGDGITLSAQADTTGFTSEVDVRAFDLSEFVPQLASPRASGRVQVQQTWGDALVANGNVRLETPQSEVVVAVRPSTSGYTITSQVDVSTGDVAIADLRGRVQGNLQLSPRSLTGDAVFSAPLTGELTVRELAVATSDWFFDGQVTASGTVRDPSANLNLTGRGSASGQLTGSVDVRGVRLQSTLAINDIAGEAVVSDLQLAISPDLQLADARGNVSYGQYHLNLADVSTNELQLTGDGVLAGWQSLINLQDQTLSVQGDVSTVTDVASGQIDVRVNAQADDWLVGTLTNVAASGVELGDVNLLGTGGLGGQVALGGEQVEAAISLDDLSWQVGRLVLNLPADLTATLQGQGQAADADLTASLAGELAGEAFEFPLNARYQQGDAQVTIASTPLFGGEVDVDLNVADGTLDGSLNLAEVTLAGTLINASGNVAGSLTSPEAMLNLDVLQGENQLMGEASFVNGSLELDTTLASALLDEPLQVSGQVLPEVNLQASQLGETLRIQVDSGRISSQGELSLDLAGVVLELTGSPSAASSLELRADASNVAPGLAFQTRLPQTLSDVDSITLIGLENTAGAIRVDIANRTVNVDELRWQAPEDLAALPASVSVTGSVQQTDAGLQGQLSGEYQSGRDRPVDPTADLSQPVDATADVTATSAQAEQASLRQPSQRPLPWLADFENVPFVLTLDGQQVNLEVPSNLGNVNADLSLTPLSLAVQGDLRLAEGRAQLDVRYDQEQGPAGSVVLERVPLLISPAQASPDDTAPDPAADPITNLPVTTLAVTSTVNLQPSGLDLRGNVQVFEGQVGLHAQAGWSQVLPAGLAESYFPASGDELSAELLLDNFNPQVVPQVAARAPNLTAPLSGALSIRENVLLGQLVSPRLAVFDSNLPLTLELSGTLDAPAIQGTLGRNQLIANVTNGQLTGRLNLAQFPLHSLAEAVIGDLDLDARTTAAIRFGLPLADAANGLIVDVATERVRFLQAGEVVSTGDVSLLYEDGALTIRRARFDSTSDDDIDPIRGFWEARGNVTPELLDVQLVAQDADFTPILQLLPNLAALELDVRGSLALITSGSLTDPTVSLTSPLVTVGLGDSVYRVEDTDVSITNGMLDASSRIDAGAPLAGRLLIAGNGNLTEDVNVQLTGDLELPPLGLIDDINITVVPTQPGVPATGSMRLGNPLNITGTLAPVSLELSGQNLDINAPAFTLASSITDISVFIDQLTRADLDPPSDPAGQVVYVISGQIFTEQAQLETAPADPDAPPPNRADGPPTPNPFLEQVIFDNLRIFAPQRVNFQQNVITAEARIDLTLAGTAAEPTLSGRAETIRGNVRFSGRDFSLSEAAAIFEPSRGALPRLNVDAQTTYQKQDVLSGNAEDVIIEPRGSSFIVFLAIDGELSQTDAGIPSLQLEPTLTSNAQVLVSGVERPLTDQEIITLLTLGRLELSDNPLDAGGLAGSVANTALDTAVDTFLLAQLQSALSEALNVDLFEIRTSSVSSLVAGDDDPFGVSVRLGTYIADNLFASFRVGSFDDPDQAFALSNEFSLRYDFSPFFVEFTGGVNFPSDPTLSPVPVFDVAFNYAVNRALSVQTGLGYTSEGAVTDVRLRFGVDYRF